MRFNKIIECTAHCRHRLFVDLESTIGISSNTPAVGILTSRLLENIKGDSSIDWLIEGQTK